MDDPGADAWENIGDAPVLADPSSAAEAQMVDDDEVDAIDGQEVQAARGIPAPPEPTPAQVARRNPTHYPYRRWCPHCLACRRPNSQHRRSFPANARTIPLACADYAFVKDSRDDNLTTMLVGRLYPSMSVLASVCDAKGNDEQAISRLAAFIKESGIARLVHKTSRVLDHSNDRGGAPSQW